MLALYSSVCLFEIAIRPKLALNSTSSCPVLFLSKHIFYYMANWGQDPEAAYLFLQGGTGRHTYSLQGRFRIDPPKTAKITTKQIMKTTTSLLFLVQSRELS